VVCSASEGPERVVSRVPWWGCRPARSHDHVFVLSLSLLVDLVVEAAPRVSPSSRGWRWAVLGAAYPIER
jgi:hypothetical protein